MGAGDWKWTDRARDARAGRGGVELLGRAKAAPAPGGAPLYGASVAAGFPSPADDYVESALDLNEYLVGNPAATFMVRVSGESMLGAGIHDGDVLVVDRSRDPAPGRIVVAVLDGELTVKRLRFREGSWVLAPENPAFEPIVVGSAQELHVWGVVTGVVRRY
ncbi:LexA family protein [Paucidesulfovibrio longus]|uniref:LexA family protein n=1 Tax=Paucidesulfovibrio longus TaxID=889 RepID=UPI0004211709|nr:translesion error-prone DNA polymerase V autoproteolytic subunit [Paucidesulfovibrio longus]